MLIFGLCSTSDDGWVIWVIKVNQNAKKGPLSHQNIILIFGLHSTSDDSAEQSEWQKSTKMWKRPPKSSKIKCSFLDYVQLLMICQVILAMKVDQNAKKGPLSHQKIKCSYLDYVQLLMIGWAIWVTKVNQNAKKAL